VQASTVSGWVAIALQSLPATMPPELAHGVELPPHSSEQLNVGFVQVVLPGAPA
jgi:hypothetical protein